MTIGLYLSLFGVVLGPNTSYLFVSPDGNDKVGNPYKTINAAAQAAVSNQTVWVTAGVYDETVTNKEGVTFFYASGACHTNSTAGKVLFFCPLHSHLNVLGNGNLGQSDLTLTSCLFRWADYGATNEISYVECDFLTTAGSLILKNNSVTTFRVNRKAMLWGACCMLNDSPNATVRFMGPTEVYSITDVDGGTVEFVNCSVYDYGVGIYSGKFNLIGGQLIESGVGGIGVNGGNLTFRDVTLSAPSVVPDDIWYGSYWLNNNLYYSPNGSVAVPNLRSASLFSTNGFQTTASSWQNVPVLKNGDNYYCSSNGVPHVIWKDQNGAVRTNRLIP